MTDKGNGTFRLAIAGMGGRGVSMTRLILDSPHDVQIVGLVDRIRARAELTRDYYDLSLRCFDNAAECLDAAEPDALIAFTSDAWHEEVVVPALQRDVHVYCEKPMATTLEACDRMIAAAEKSQALFYMGHNMRMGPMYHTIHEIVAGGDIGELLTLEMNEYYHGGRTYFRRWNRLLDVGGGLWITKSTHDFDMMAWLAGSEPVSVYAVGGLRHFRPKAGAAGRCRNCPLADQCDDYQPPDTLRYDERARDERQLRFWDEWRRLGEPDGYLPADACLYRGDIETIDHGIATVKFASGACATYAMSCVTTPQLSGRWLTATGTKGAILSDPRTGKIHVSYRGAKPPQAYDTSALRTGSHGGADDRVVADFLRCCRGGGAPIATHTDGRRAVMMGLAAQQSMQTAAAVKCEEVT